MIQEIKSKGFSNSPLQWIIYLLIFGLLATLFFQNFIYSDSFESLSLFFRRIDDIAFQLVLRDMHHAMIELNFKGFLATNNYSYGWIYWFPLALLTFPFYLIDSHVSEIAIIVIPREISLFWQIGTIIIVYKIMMHFTFNKKLSLLAVFSFVLFPSFGIYSSVFGTPSQIQFFASLAIYLTLIVKEIDTRSIIKIALSIAFAGATKVTGLMVLPIVGLLLLKKLNFRLNISNFKFILLFMFILISIWWILYNPLLVFSFFDKKLWSDFITNFTYGFSTINVNVLESISIFEKLENGIASGTFHWSITLLLLLLLLIEIFIRYKKNEDYQTLLMIFLGLFVIVMFLCINVKNGVSYIVNYFTIANYLFLLGFVLLNRINKKVSLVIIIGLVSLNFCLNFKNFNDPLFGYFSSFNSIENTKKKQEINERIYSLLLKYGINQKTKLNIIREYNALELFSSMRKNISQVVSFINFHSVKEQLEYYDLISLNIGEEDIKVSPEIAKLDQEEIENLIKTKRLKNIEYEILYKDEKYLILINKNLLNKERL